MSGNGGVCPGPGSDLLLKISENFLNRRNFDACRKFALRVQATDPTNAAAAQILAVVDVLSASAGIPLNYSPNWYAILGLKNNAHSEQDSNINIIKTRVDTLSLFLNPSTNKLALAGEAFALVTNAWAVLSDPLKKARFDNGLGAFKSGGEIKTEGKCGSGSGMDSFWTVCPYCYYVYEYPRVYEDCCLKCYHESCGKAFQAVAIRSPPPAAVVKKGEYLCLGFIPVGFEEGDGSEAKGFSSWTPFAFGPTSKMEEKTDVPKDNSKGFNMDSFVEISDDSDDELFRESNDEKLQREGFKNGDGITDGGGVSVCTMGVAGVMKPVLKRKKSVAKNTEKVMGKGIRVKIHTTAGSGEGVEMDLGVNDGNLGREIAIAGGVEVGSWGDAGMGEIQFFDGVDDVFVGVDDVSEGKDDVF